MVSLRLLPKVKSKGDLSLLDELLTAPFCSNRCTGDLVLKTYDLAGAMHSASAPVIGGFQPPMERECLRLPLKASRPSSSVLPSASKHAHPSRLSLCS